MLKRYIFFLFILPFMGSAQTQLVLNNNGYIVIDNGAYLVVDNPAANAVTTLGTGGNIVSEDEANVLQWNIGHTTGIYVIPWTTSSGVKIPLSINKTAPGTGATAEFVLSTYETTTDANLPLPAAVTNMNYSGVNKSLFVVDRFWHIDALSYTAKPAIELIIGYDAAANEMVGTNTITEANLQAQRFNTTLGHWEAYKLFGTANTGTKVVNGIVIPSADFYEDWILVDNSNPLPVTLTNFTVDCDGDRVLISWSTASEINNDYFAIERSTDAINFEPVGTVNGNGNSNTTINYTWVDDSPLNGTVFYRLKQTDFNGAFDYHGVRSITCEQSTEFSIYPNPFENSFTVQLSENTAYPITLEVIDNLGRRVHSQVIESATTEIALDELAKGTYFVKVFNDEIHIVERIVKTN